MPLYVASITFKFIFHIDKWELMVCVLPVDGGDCSSNRISDMCMGIVRVEVHEQLTKFRRSEDPLPPEEGSLG